MVDAEGFEITQSSIAAAAGWRPPPFLRLPTELRLRTYELAFDAAFINQKFRWNDRNESFILRLYGTQDYRGQVITTSGSPFNLLRACRQLHDEVAPALPSIQEIMFELNDFSELDMQYWLGLMSGGQISRIRMFRLFGWGECQLKRSRFPVPCSRAIMIDLRPVENTFVLEILTFKAIGRISRDNAKANYLKSPIWGCVVIPKPYSHPNETQCYSSSALDSALAGLITDDGKVIVTRDSITKLRRVVMGDSAEK